MEIEIPNNIIGAAANIGNRFAHWTKVLKKGINLLIQSYTLGQDKKGLSLSI